jgi:FKBP12-rapamycin complex-associated protein
MWQKHIHRFEFSKIHKLIIKSFQAWVYALTAATKSRNARRSIMATEILEIISENKPTLVEQAMIVNDELIRCAILWHEHWHEALEEASKFYFQVNYEPRIELKCNKKTLKDKNVDEMMNVLRPLHQKIETGHTTLKEQSFNHVNFNRIIEVILSNILPNSDLLQGSKRCFGAL